MTNKEDLSKVEMETFDFYKDEKVVYWERTSFTVKSKTYEDSENVAKQLLETKLNESETVSIDGCCFVENIGVLVTPEQNEGASTVRIFKRNGHLIASNSEILQE